MSMDNAAPAESVTPLTINLKTLKKGTVLLLEGETDIYELTLLYPEQGIAEISSSLTALRKGTVGQFLFSVRWSSPETRLDGVRQGWAMMLRFRNGEIQTQPIMSASVNGKREDGSRWSYIVF